MLLQESLLSDLTVATEPVTAVQICWASCVCLNNYLVVFVLDCLCVSHTFDDAFIALNLAVKL